ncbi:MAG TPA: bifunctional proline dehydrogenase/L-glutamate gamma-semialdehyde dehydrogenase PutA [Burkholderiaceae bacterium]|nr:bifunctional proline dehydrogenase/L-glutamate gamma-semialdehyde dehydrogenase PutA [Burkholderiaceae bacterium]
MTTPVAALDALPDLGDPAPPEEKAVAALLARGAPAPEVTAAARSRALRYIETVRSAAPGMLSAQNLLNTFPLASPEGVALLRLAEALLRAPDPETQTWLIAEKLAAFRDRAVGGEGFIASVLGKALALAGHTAADAALRELRGEAQDAGSLRAWLARSTLRPLVIDGIRRFGDQFVFATSLATATARSRRQADGRITHSFDMLGEGARTAADAERSYAAYEAAIAAVGAERQGADWTARDGVSVKLSAIHPRFEVAQLGRVDSELYARLLELASQAAAAGINFTIDAEESERLVLHIELLERLMREPALAGWPGLGLALQAYAPRALATLDRLARHARECNRPIAIRLVKGAYWDGEIKRAQELGLTGFPVYTRKWATDLSYLAAARTLLAADAPIYPQFATHNAMTVAAIVEYARELAPGRPYEFQRLHGMGEPLYAALLADERAARMRIYAPVGEFRDLLAYLVRRLLENGANSSFVHQLTDRAVAPEALVQDAWAQAATALKQGRAASALPSGQHLFGDRRNSLGLDLARPDELAALTDAVAAPLEPVDLGVPTAGAPAELVRNPAAPDELIARVHEPDAAALDALIRSAVDAQPAWDAAGVTHRAARLDALAEALEDEQSELIRLLVREAGRTMIDAHFEVREAVDFCRYYAAQARGLMAPQALPGPAGESNRLLTHGRGVFVAISPWNFPLAIFLGQVAAALVTGNTVLAKPAEQTPRVAARVVQLAHAAGIPSEVLQLVPGRGETVGRALTSDPRIAGVVFTGSTPTARSINRALAAREAPIGVLIAETGGQNAMIVDSTALPEQVCDAVIASAFRSCGQRCSALRVLYVQEEIADGLLAMIAGAMRELVVGDPRDPATDVGPVIDPEQLAQLQAHSDWLRAHARRIHECETPALPGHFFGPIAYEIDSMAQLTRENFGPVLHVVRFDKHRLDAVIAEIHASGYGLTMGLHTRLDARVDAVAGAARVGNLYVNRNIIGAVVGSQPFGGEGLSGTGPKAGGPHYLARFVAERTLTINTAAAGGNVELAAGTADDA